MKNPTPQGPEPGGTKTRTAAEILGLVAAVALCLAAGGTLLATLLLRRHETLAESAFVVVIAGFATALGAGILAFVLSWASELSRLAQTRGVLKAVFSAHALGPLVPVLVLLTLYWIASPMFSGLIRKSAEGVTKGNLAFLRDALSRYRKDNGRCPANLAALTAGGRYLRKIPPAKVPDYRRNSARVTYGRASDGAGGWLYDNVAGDADYGSIRVNCTGTDTRGSVWTSY